MKKLVLSCSLMALTLPAYAADTINCATLPSCSSLGYTENADDCVGRKLLCPFDKTQAACLEKPHVGDLKYSLYSSNHDGWLRCDGSQYSTTTYSKLYGVIGQNFCRTYSSRTDTGTTGKCDSGKFAVPDYRGFFLRGYRWSNSNAVDAKKNYPRHSNAIWHKGNYARWESASFSTFGDELYIPEFEQLPKITGKAPYTAPGQYQNNISGAFYTATVSGSQQNGSYGIGFDASRSSPIYDGSHVVPANYAAYIFIYAGEE